MDEFNVGAAIVTSLGTVGTYLALIIPAGLGLWAILFTVGFGKKAARKAAS